MKKYAEWLLRASGASPNRLRYPVLKCAAPVDDASLQFQGRANRPRGLAVSLIQSSESMWSSQTENAGEASEGPEQTARSGSSRADASFASPVLGTCRRARVEVILGHSRGKVVGRAQRCQ